MAEPESLSTRLTSAPVTVALFAICIVVFVLAERSGDTTTNETLLIWGASWRGLVWRGEWWRLLTSCFLHIGIAHLAWNLVAGFSWAAPVERALGPARFLLLYLVSGIVGSALSVLGHDVVAAGSSGALFGCIGASFWLEYSRLGDWKAVAQSRRGDLWWIAIWFGMGLFGSFDNFAHLGGLTAGISLGWWLEKRSKRALAAVLVNVAIVPLSLVPTFMTTDTNAIAQANSEGRYADAITLIEEAETEAQTPYLIASRAYALERLGKTAELQRLLDSVSAEQWSPDLRVTQAIVFNSKGDVDAGLAVLDLAVASDQNHAGARVQRAWAFIHMDPARLPEDLAVLERLNEPTVPLLRGWAALKRGDLPGARLQASLAPKSAERSDLEAAISDAGQ